MPPKGGLSARYQVDETATRGQERAFSVTVGDWGGTEIRPTRVFMWIGPRERGVQRLLTTGRQPRLLRGARRRRHLHVRGLWLSYLGNPLVTLVLLGFNALRGAPTDRAARGA